MFWTNFCCFFNNEVEEKKRISFFNEKLTNFYLFLGGDNSSKNFIWKKIWGKEKEPSTL